MICDFKKWTLLENFGNGVETFEVNISSGKNLSFFSPSDWEIDSASGKVTYQVELEVKRDGIQDIIFSLKSIELEMKILHYDEHDNESVETKTFSFNPGNVESIKVTVESLPYYLNDLEIDFRNAEDLDGEIDLKKIKIEAIFGS